MTNLILLIIYSIIFYWVKHCQPLSFLTNIYFNFNFLVIFLSHFTDTDSNKKQLKINTILNISLNDNCFHYQFVTMDSIIDNLLNAHIFFFLVTFIYED